MTQLVRVSAWVGIPALVSELGGDPAEVLARAGIDPHELAEPDAYLPLDAFIRTLEAAVDVTGRQDFGMLSAAPGGFRSIGILGIAVRNAATVREAIETCIRFSRINNSDSTMTVVPIPDTGTEFICLESARPLGPDTVQMHERLLATTHVLCAAISQDHHKPVEFRLMHEQNASADAYKAVFGQLPKFNQPSIGMIIKSAQMDIEIASRSAELGDMAMTYLQGFASSVERPFADVARTVAKVLIELGACTPADMASALNLHERTLQRRLKEEGSSFEAVRDIARMQIADVLIRRNTHSLTEIAHILGYADSSTLSRSCNRWFGDTPTNIRAKTNVG